MILKNLPEDLEDHNEWKTFIDKVCPNPNNIAKLRRPNDVLSKKTAVQIVENVQRAEPSLSISVKEPAFVSAVERVPEDLDKLSLKQRIPKST